MPAPIGYRGVDCLFAFSPSNGCGPRMSVGRKTQYKLVALDIDGTVINAAQEVSPALKRALSALPGLGVRTVLCTGRRWRTAVPVLEQLEHVHPLVVCCGGALIKQADDEETLFSAPMEDSAARTVADLLRGLDLVPLFLYDRPLSGRELAVSECDRARAERLPYVQANREWVEWLPSDYPPGPEPPLEVYTMDDTAVVGPAEPRVRRGIGALGLVEAMLQERYGAGQLALEVHHPSATKWHALLWLLDSWRIRPEEVVAIGDDVNDVPMLRAAGRSFAMGNAVPEVIAVADAVTASNEEDGVAAALRTAFPIAAEEGADHEQ